MGDDKDLRRVVAGWLKEDGYDGLYSEDMGCGCDIDDLMCCDEPSPKCKPGYAGTCDEHCEMGGGCDYHIQPTKP